MTKQEALEALQRARDDYFAAVRGPLQPGWVRASERLFRAFCDADRRYWKIAAQKEEKP